MRTSSTWIATFTFLFDSPAPVAAGEEVLSVTLHGVDRRKQITMFFKFDLRSNSPLTILLGDLASLDFAHGIVLTRAISNLRVSTCRSAVHGG